MNQVFTLDQPNSWGSAYSNDDSRSLHVFNSCSLEVFCSWLQGLLEAGYLKPALGSRCTRTLKPWS